MKTFNKLFLIVILSLFYSSLFATTILSPIGYQTDFEDEEEVVKPAKSGKNKKSEPEEEAEDEEEEGGDEDKDEDED